MIKRDCNGTYKRGGEREHLSAYMEQLTASASVPHDRLCLGHINADMDSVGGTVGATELYDAGMPALLNHRQF
jgi:c-di-AMP phosphodiesterase-like protein